MNSTPLNPQDNQNPEPAPGPLIRTMSKDIESLGKKPAEAPSFPQFPDYEPPPEIPLGMAPPVSDEPAAPPLGGEPPAGGPPMEIPGAPIEIPASPAEPEPPAPTPPPLTPAWPGETVISEKTLTEFAPPQPPKKDIKKLALIAGIAGLVVIMGFLGWFLYPKIFPAATPISVITPAPAFTPTPLTTPLPTPIAFFVKIPAKTAILTIAAETKNELVDAIKNEIRQIETVGTLKIIDLRKNGEPFTFNQFADMLGLNFPTGLKTLVSPEFKLFVNYHAQEGSRLGILLYLADATVAPSLLKVWENSMDTNLMDLFLDADIGTKTEFRDGQYREIAKRYLRFFKPNFSLDYALYENFLIIATSRYSMANAIDHILGEAL